jgi:hypothetical protein
MGFSVSRGRAHLVALLSIVFALASVSGIAQGGADRPQNGDLFVGAGAAVDPNFGGILGGAIKRISGGSVSTYCQSPFSGDDRWNTPTDVLVDSEGRVVFLAEIGALSYTHGVYGLLRCTGPGTVIEKLAVFGVGRSLVPIGDQQWRGYPVPFPDEEIVGNVGGLHLARRTAAVIDDDIAQGKSKLEKEDVYALVISTPSGFRSVQYRPSTTEWEEGARIVAAPRYIWSGFMPDATYYGGATYSALDNVLGRDREPFRIDVTGTIEGVYFGLRLGLFGGFTEVGGGLGQGSFEEVARTSFVVDDLLDPNPQGSCPPGSISTAVPAASASGTYAGPSGFGQVAKHRHFGLVVTSNTGYLSPYLTQFGGVLLDDNPFNDGDALFLRPELGCNAQRKLDYRPILPFWDPTAVFATSNGVERLVSGTAGLFGTQWQSGRVVQIAEGERLTTLASGLINPVGIAAYPANVPSGAPRVAIVIRIDSPVNVIVTDPAGNRIGVDPSGAIVNDFGAFGYVAGEPPIGEPKKPLVMAIREPAPGSYQVDGFGTGDGAYGVHVYWINTDRDEGEHIVTRGTAAPGAISEHDFTLADTGALAFGAAAADPDVTAPISAAVASPDANGSGWHRDDVTVTLAATDEEGGSSVKEIIFSASGAMPLAPTTASNGVVLRIAAEGVTSISYFARDVAGNTGATQTLTVMIDRTPPRISGHRTPEANAAGWNTTNVTVTFACADELSGIASCGDVPQVVTAEGAAQTRSATAVDGAGNVATAIVGAINIDRTPPSARCAASPPLLWPADHALARVQVLTEVSDLLSGPAGFVLIAAASSEPDDAPGDGDGSTLADVQGFVTGTADTDGVLRAERAGRGSGRVYRLTYEGADRAGNLVLCTAAVVVPRDRRR